MDPRHQGVLGLLRQGQHGEARRQLTARVGSAPGDYAAWQLLALSFAMEGDAERFFGVIDTRHRHFSDGLKFFYDLLSDRFQSGGNGFLEEVVAKVPRNSLLAAVAEYFAGCWAAVARDPERAIAHLHRAAAFAGQSPEQFTRDPYLFSILRDGVLCGDFGEIDGVAASDRQLLIDRLGFIRPLRFASEPRRPLGESFFFLAACNETYLDRFGRSVVEALDRSAIPTVFHLHVVAPTAALGEKVAQLGSGCRSIDLQYSVEDFDAAAAGGQRSATYYACSRFIRAQEIIDRYAGDALICDVDTAAFGDIRRAAAAMAGFDIGFFKRRHITPTLICSAAFVYLTRSERVRLYDDLVAKFILDRLATYGLWMLDQAAIYCVSSYMTARHAPFRIADFTRALGIELEAMAESDGSYDEKSALRNVKTAAAR